MESFNKNEYLRISSGIALPEKQINEDLISLTTGNKKVSSRVSSLRPRISRITPKFQNDDLNFNIFEGVQKNKLLAERKKQIARSKAEIAKNISRATKDLLGLRYEVEILNSEWEKVLKNLEKMESALAYNHRKSERLKTSSEILSELKEKLLNKKKLKNKALIYKFFSVFVRNLVLEIKNIKNKMLLNSLSEKAHAESDHFSKFSELDQKILKLRGLANSFKAIIFQSNNGDNGLNKNGNDGYREDSGNKRFRNSTEDGNNIENKTLNGILNFPINSKEYNEKAQSFYFKDGEKLDKRNVKQIKKGNADENCKSEGEVKNDKLDERKKLKEKKEEENESRFGKLLKDVKRDFENLSERMSAFESFERKEIEKNNSMELENCYDGLALSNFHLDIMAEKTKLLKKGNFNLKKKLGESEEKVAAQKKEIERLTVLLRKRTQEKIKTISDSISATKTSPSGSCSPERETDFRSLTRFSKTKSETSLTSWASTKKDSMR